MYYTQNSHHAYGGLPDQELITTSTLLAPTATRGSYMTHNHTHNTAHSRSHSNSIADHNNIGHNSDPNESTLNTTAIRQMAALADDNLALSGTLPNAYLNYDPYGGHNSEGGGGMQHMGEYSQYDMQQYYMHLQNM